VLRVIVVSKDPAYRKSPSQCTSGFRLSLSGAFAIMTCCALTAWAWKTNTVAGVCTFVFLLVFSRSVQRFVVGEPAASERHYRGATFAFLVGWACYLPIPGLRGMIIGTWPGIARRSFSVLCKGVVWGGLLDISFAVSCPNITYLFGVTWDPRIRYYADALTWFPAQLLNANQSVSISDFSKFVLLNSIWFSMMAALWVCFYNRHLRAVRLASNLLAATAYSLLAHTIFWHLTPATSAPVKDSLVVANPPIFSAWGVALLLIPLSFLALGGQLCYDSEEKDRHFTMDPTCYRPNCHRTFCRIMAVAISGSAGVVLPNC